MRKFLVIFICLLCSIPTISSAHTTITSSTPSEGEVITTDLSELSVEFAEVIEKQSTLLLTKESAEIAFDSILVNDNKIIGTLASPLENGTYTLTWKIAAKDGHAISGDIPFTVEILTEKEEESDEANTYDVEKAEAEANTDTDTATESINEGSAVSKTEKVENEAVEENSESLLPTISVIVLVVLLSVGILLIMRKKR
ncbi:copper resistance protein CopC [Metabacillus litoralis]|uniref:copper resistance CopC family protein n=1 Tax=Metabacillus litoralis TaxID=152268 RepID=UPI001CFEA5E3|nr:copper resistance CopC family protein [Metabacillus litoralis]